MTELQEKAVRILYHIYGNAGPYYTQGNHEFLRRTLDGEENPEHYQPTDACKEAFRKVMEGDWSPLPPRVRERLEQDEEERKRIMEAAGIDEDDLKGQDNGTLEMERATAD